MNTPMDLGSTAAVQYLPMVGKTTLPYINPFGIVMYGEVDAARGLPQMQAAGAKRVVTVLDWGTIEPAEGTLNWSSFDTKVSNARSAGMEIVVLFIGDPSWAWLPDRSATVAQKRLNFVRAMVERYNCNGVDDAGPNMCVHTWSFYAEPDFYVSYLQATPGTKGYWGKRGAEYAHMIAGVAQVIHQRDPKARVMIGGLAYDAFIDPTNPEHQRGFNKSFLPTVLETLNTQHGGAARTIDAVAVHYYPILYPSIRDKLAEIRGIMHTYNINHLPLVIPEGGFWSATDAGSSEAAQAQRVVQHFVESLSMGVEYVAWYNVFDNGGGTETSGLFRGTDLRSPKPAYFAYQTMTRELSGYTYSRPFGQTGVDGYVFVNRNGGEKTVVWVRDQAQPAVFVGSCLQRVAISDTTHAIVQDGTPPWDKDGRINGQIVIEVAPVQPLYIKPCT
jgi:hypothetical protein